MTESPIMSFVAALVTIYSLFQILLGVLTLYRPWVTYEIPPPALGFTWGPSKPQASSVIVHLRNHGLKAAKNLWVRMLLDGGNFTGEKGLINPKGTDFTVPNRFSKINSPDHVGRPDEPLVFPIPNGKQLIAKFPKFPRGADITIDAEVSTDGSPFFANPIATIARVDVSTDHGSATPYTMSVKADILIRNLELLFYAALFLIVLAFYLAGYL